MITPEQLAKSGTEHGHQAALFCWASMNQLTFPQVRWLYAVPNGFFGSAGQKAKMKAEGLKNGVPDVFLPVKQYVPNRVVSLGLYIELKIPEKKRDIDDLAGCSEEQVQWIEFLRNEGYKVYVCYGWEDARDKIIEYLKGFSYLKG